MTYYNLDNFTQVGTLIYVEINKDAGLIRRTYSDQLPCVSGEVNPFNQTKKEISDAFNNEIAWLTKLDGSKFLPELVSYDLDSQSIVQKYYQPSCLLTGKIPSVEEVVELYYFFKSHNINKINGSLSNMSYNDSQLIAFDFKYTKERPVDNVRELHSYNTWLIKIDQSLPEILTKILYE